MEAYRAVEDDVGLHFPRTIHTYVSLVGPISSGSTARKPSNDYIVEEFMALLISLAGSLSDEPNFQ